MSPAHPTQGIMSLAAVMDDQEEFKALTAELIGAGMPAGEAMSWARELMRDRHLSRSQAIAWHQAGMSCEDALEWINSNEPWTPAEAAMWDAANFRPKEALFVFNVLNFRLLAQGRAQVKSEITAWANSGLPAHWVCFSVASDLPRPEAHLLHAAYQSSNPERLAETRTKAQAIGADPVTLTI